MNSSDRAEQAFQAIASTQCDECGEDIRLDVQRKGEVEPCTRCGERYCLACGAPESGDCDCFVRCGECGRCVEPASLGDLQMLAHCDGCGMYVCNLCGAVTFCSNHDLNNEEDWAERGDHAFLADPPVLTAAPARAPSDEEVASFFGELTPIATTYGGMFVGWPGMYSYAAATFEVAGVFVIQAEWSSAPGMSGTHYLAANPDETLAAIREVEARFQARFKDIERWLETQQGGI